MKRFRIIKITFLSILIGISQLTIAQQDNLYAENNSDDVNGCDYYVTPLAALCCGTIVPVTALRLLLQKGDDYTFTRTQLTTELNCAYQYVGARVEYHDATHVDLNICAPYLEETNEEGDCQGGATNVVYDDSYIANTSQLYIMDDQ